MARVGLRISLIGIAIGTIFYQFVYKSIILKDLGYSRVLEPLGSFGVRCETIDDPGLVGCTNMWLQQETGVLYMTCSDSMTRRYVLSGLLVCIDTESMI
jgi:arylesterase/paraoxonase